jgi:isopenicillin-N N-acyltransferase-like protein
MTYRFRSTVTDPYERGFEFATVHAQQVTETVAAYQQLFDAAAGQATDMNLWGTLAFDTITEHSPKLGREIAGIADGAGLPVTSIAAINARTEVLAALGAAAHECSTVVALRDGRAPVSVQAWDWYAGLADLWLVWEIPHPDGGHTTTVTEYGIVGKIGVNDRGLGIHFNILHHALDGCDSAKIGVPVHVLARSILDEARDLNEAMLRAAQADVTASTSLTMVAVSGTESAAVSVELNPAGVGYALPDAGGLLVHTNHFLSTPAHLQDTELRNGPDTVIRYDMLRRRLAGRDVTTADTLAALSSHLMSGGGTCCHVDPTLPSAAQFQTLATVVLDVANGTLAAHPGGACTAPAGFAASTEKEKINAHA